METTTAPAGFVPAATELDNNASAKCSTGCGVVPIVRRPRFSRSNYRSGVVSEELLPGVVRGRDFVTGVQISSTFEVRIVTC